MARERACPFPCLNKTMEKEPVATTCPPTLIWATGYAGPSRWGGDAGVPSTAVYDRVAAPDISGAVALLSFGEQQMICIFVSCYKNFKLVKEINKI